MGRSDTGMDTLVEDTDAEKGAKKVDLEADPMPRFHAIGEKDAERERGLGVRVQDIAEKDVRWRALR
jgi:hypothetical protein